MTKNLKKNSAERKPDTDISFNSGDRQVTDWRFIPPITASGKMQMAIDRWLLEQHRQGKHPPTLRFYTWQPAAISLGYHQREYPASWDNLIWNDLTLDIVRRPTGGRAVLHQGDLTYAVVTSVAPGKRLAVYKEICQFLISGWRSLGIDLNYGTQGKEYINDPNCFATATEADLITKEGFKAIGSSQLRKGKAILQHGSMSLNVDKHLFHRVFNRPHLGNLRELTDLTQSKIVTALSQAAVSCFKINLAKQPLSDAEWEDIVTNFLC